MSFFFNKDAPATPVTEINGASDKPQAVAAQAAEKMYDELIVQRPVLLDEKVKIHERIIDEFNLASLEKIPRGELVGVVRGFMSEYVRTEKLSLNLKEQHAFAEEIVDEMVGFGPIEPLAERPDRQ